MFEGQAVLKTLGESANEFAWKSQKMRRFGLFPNPQSALSRENTLWLAILRGTSGGFSLTLLVAASRALMSRLFSLVGTLMVLECATIEICGPLNVETNVSSAPLCRVFNESKRTLTPRKPRTSFSSAARLLHRFGIDP